MLVGWFAILPLAIAVMVPYTRAFWASASASTPTLPTDYVLASVRLCLFWLVLACGISTTLAVYVAPDGEMGRYARASLPFYAAFFVLLIIEAVCFPAIFRWFAPTLHLSASGSFFRAGEFALTLACGLLAFAVGQNVGLSARRRPQSIGVRLLEKCRRLPVGRGFGGQKLRLNL